MASVTAPQTPATSITVTICASEYGASAWCGPYRWIPQAARLLRPGGRLVFMAPATLARMCIPGHGPATSRLVYDLSGLHRILQRGTSGSGCQLFTLPPGNGSGSWAGAAWSSRT